MNRNAFLKILKSNGVEFLKHGSRHDIYVHIASGKRISIPRHGEFENTFLKIILGEIPKDERI